MSTAEVFRDSFTIDTNLALALVAFGRAPVQVYVDGRLSGINRRIVCADGFRVSIQASLRHYCNDSSSNPEPLYFRLDADEPTWPFTSVEVGNPSDDMPEVEPWTEDGGGVWGFVPLIDAARLLDLHGGATSWEVPSL